MKPLARVIRYLRPYWVISVVAVVSMFLVSGANLITPQLLRRIIDEGISAGNYSVVLGMTAALVFVAAVRGIFTFLQNYLAEKASQGSAYDLRNQIYDKLQTLSFSFHDQQQTGQLMTRVTSDVEIVRQFAGQGFLQLVGALAMIVGAAAVLIAMNWRLAIVSLLTLPLVFVVFGFTISKAQPLFGIIQAKLGALNTVLQENLAGVRVVKAFVREDHEAERYSRANQELLVENLRVVRIMSAAFPTAFTVASLGTLAVIWYGGGLVIAGQISLGELVAFSTYLAYLTFPVFMLGMIIAGAARAAASAKRIFEVVDAEVEVRDKPNAIELGRAVGRVEFQGVAFRYIAAERNVLEDVSFVAEPGQTVAIVGSTGSGKSTIINLIPRFYDVTAGRVLVDGHDVRDVNLESLRRQIGIVLQDTMLFSGTIRENVAYGVPEASFEDVLLVAQLAQAHDFIVDQPNGYDTKIGEGGVGLSGGQKQRIAIARALLLSPRILILDDSTSSVDAETEYQIQQALDQLMHTRTSFVIAQRISTVRNADLILVVDNARIVARGSHEELLETSALYGDIVASQLRDDAPDLPTPEMLAVTEARR